MKRVFLIVLDSLGIGALPDAASFGDQGSDTLKAITPLCDGRLDTLTSLGLYCIDGTPRIEPNPPRARVARLLEMSAGKDTTIGHWELAGVTSPSPLPTYPCGFPNEILDPFIKKTGREVLCNLPYSGTEVIRDYGEEQMKTGKWIVYTSADSVFQIASHEEIIPLEELYRACDTARALLCGKHAVGRVIARPYTGEPGNFTRTKNRHDYSLAPPSETMLDLVKANGFDVIGIGKIRDIFAGRGLTEHIPSANNSEGMNQLDVAVARDFHGLCFCNLVDFDMIYGHRNDVHGYADALCAFDQWLNGFLPKLQKDDLLIVTADHGCDPSTPSTDHSREAVPCLVYSKEISPKNLGTRSTFSDVAATVLDFLDVKHPFLHANSLL
ncbi:MAG: phosphopentomutase [Clostridia bacterium]|nr:phosphopentomutase [Clostridia bacterium]